MRSTANAPGLWPVQRPDGTLFTNPTEQDSLAYAIDRASKQGFAGGLTHRDAIAKAQVQALSREGALPRLAPAPDVIAMATVGSGQSAGVSSSPETRLVLMIGIENGWSGAQAAYDSLWPALDAWSSSGLLPDLAQRAGWALDFSSLAGLSSPSATEVQNQSSSDSAPVAATRMTPGAMAALGPVVPTATLSVSPASITAGAAATLTWSTSNATSVSINQGIGAVAVSGTKNVSPTATTTYTLTATNNAAAAQAITHVASDGTYNANTTSQSLTVAPAAIGNLLVVGFDSADPAANPGISDTGGHTWKVLNAKFTDNPHHQVLISWYAIATTTSPITIRAVSNRPNNWISMTLDQFSGVDTSNPLDQHVESLPEGSASNPAIGSSMTPSVDNELMWAFAAGMISGTGNIDGSAASPGGDSRGDDRSEYRILTGRSGVPMTASFTTYSPFRYNILSATFRPASGQSVGSVTATAIVTVTAAADTTPPVLSAVASSGLTTSGATIGFTTNEQTYHQVEYGPTAAYGTLTPLDTTLRTSHSQVLTGLTAGTVYHYRVRATDASGNGAMSGDFTFTTPTTPPPSNLAVGTVVSSDGAGTRVTPLFSTATAGELLVAFASADGPANGTRQTITVSGAGLTWTLARRGNAQDGTAEMWTATAPTPLANVAVTATAALTGFSQSLTVVTFVGADGIGATAAASAATGVSSVSVTTTRAGSLVYGVGNDSVRAVPRMLAANQAMVHEWFLASEAFWVQSRTTPVATAGSLATINDTGPTSGRWNYAAVEILAASTARAAVAVPNVVSQTQAAATTAINNAALVVGTVTSASSGSVASGSVISSSPVAGTQVAAGSAVNLVVSMGPAPVAVPNVVGQTQAAATSAITGAGLVVGTVTSASSATVASGSVISSSPLAGTQVAAGSAVSLVVSTGPTPPPPPPTAISIWSASATPSMFATMDSSAVELGLKFRSDVAGTVTGVRFYKGSMTTGTHTGTLWSVSGTKLASATFTGETASGWQTVTFSSPVAIAANTVYVVSYHTNVGQYASTWNTFAAAGVDNGPLHALRAGESGGNGVYQYGGNVFPTSSYNSTNYWVDVLFVASTALVP